MPTRTLSPSRLAHSCSFVYLRSAGMFAIAVLVIVRVAEDQEYEKVASSARPIAIMRSTSLLHARRIKRCFHHAGRSGLAANFHTEIAADGRVRRLDVAQRDRLVDRWAVGSRGHHAERVTVLD